MKIWTFIFIYLFTIPRTVQTSKPKFYLISFPFGLSLQHFLQQRFPGDRFSQLNFNRKCPFCSCFSFSTLKMWFHSLLASIVSDDKSAITILCSHMQYFIFSLGFFQDFLLIFSSSSLMPMVVLFILLVVHWASWICKSVFFIRFGKF